MSALTTWLGKVYSDDQSASFGRIISTVSFIVMVLLHIAILINPHQIFTNFKYVDKITDNLFYLTIGGYSVSSIKEVVNIIFAKIGIAPNITNIDNNTTTNTKVVVPPADNQVG